MKGNKQVDLQKELEKMVNESTGSYDSKDSDSDTDSNGDNSNRNNEGKIGNMKSRFAKR